MIVIIIIIIILQPRHSIHSFSFTHPSPTLRSLSPPSTTTNLHIFLSLSCSFLLAASSWLSHCKRCFLPPRGSQDFRTHCQKCCIFMISKNPRHLASQAEFCRTMGQRTIKPGETLGQRTMKPGGTLGQRTIKSGGTLGQRTIKPGGTQTENHKTGRDTDREP